MQLRHLEYLVALAHAGHFGRAAQACHVSQPALSAGIRNLERELHIQIVQRGQRFDGFTPEGAHVLKWAQRTLSQQESLRQELANMGEGLSGTLRLGAIPTALTISSLLTTPVRRRHPQIRFSLESMSSREIVARLNDFDIDVGLTYVDGEPLGKVRVIPLYREQYLFVTPQDGPFGAHTSMTWAQAAAAPLCLLDPGMQNRRILDSHFAEAGIEPRAVVESDTVSAIYAHVAAMELSSVFPHAWLYAFDAPPGTRVLALPPPRRAFHVGLVLAGGDHEPMLARTLVDAVSNVDVAGELERVVARRLGESVGSR